MKGILSEIKYSDKVKSFVNEFNSSSSMLNILIANQSTGIIGDLGTISVTCNAITTPITSNYNVDLGDGTNALTISLSNWMLFFSATREIVSVTSISDIDLSSYSTGYIYLKLDGTHEIVSPAPYSTYQSNSIRLLRFEKNSDNYYSIIVMPELCGTPKFSRSKSRYDPFLNVKDISVTFTTSNDTAWQSGVSYLTNDLVVHNSVGYKCLINHTSGTFDTDLAGLNWEKSNNVSFKRMSTKSLTEGCGCFSTNLDPNILLFSDIDVVKLLDNNSYTEYLDLDTVGTSGEFLSAQLSLTPDGKFIVQKSENSYTSIQEAMNELPFEHYIPARGDSIGVYLPVIRVAYKANTVDLTNSDEGYMLNMTISNELARTPVWYVI